jgi:hypothetical protein
VFGVSRMGGELALDYGAVDASVSAQAQENHHGALVHALGGVGEDDPDMWCKLAGLMGGECGVQCEVSSGSSRSVRHGRECLDVDAGMTSRFWMAIPYDRASGVPTEPLPDSFMVVELVNSPTLPQSMWIVGSVWIELEAFGQIFSHYC